MTSQTCKIATWNVNSVRARLPNVIDWLAQVKPDILLLQEIKCEEGAFPVMEFRAAGYDVRVAGQKSYNGVAIASLHPIENLRCGLPGDDSDTQARYIEAHVCGVRVASIYLPNGNPTGTEKYAYKLAWMARLKQHAATLLKDEIPVVLGGDYNVIPEALDAADPRAWEGDALFLPQTRAAFRELIFSGYTDIFRALNPHKENAFTFWDYQAGSWQRDNGIRIDHFLLSPEAVDKALSCQIDREPRGKDKASDHTPVILELVLTA